MSAQRETCGARTTFWPDVEAIDAECFLPRGHEPAQVHEDEALGEWNEDELVTYHPERPASSEEKTA
ncbi:hypothetical protein [Streptomyces spinosus]|uniref:hypothetical protein n=1 Tax=Streptomyces spinosus TaxID=2872623 RepID=UPI001CEC418F|nr:hypothetical protein [Streptomyces spinosus]